MTDKSAIMSGYTVTLSQLLKLGLQLASVMILTRFFSPEDFGILAIASLAVVIIELIRDRGLTTVLLSDKSASNAQIFKLGQKQIKIAIAFWLVMTITGLILDLSVSFGGSTLAFTLLGAIPIFSAIQMPSVVLLSRQGNFRAQNIAEVSSYLVGLVIALIIAISTGSVLAILLQPMLNAAVGSLVRFVYLPWPIIRKTIAENTFALERKGKHLLFSNVINLSAANSDTAALVSQATPFQFGGYSRLYQILVGSAGQIMTSLGPLMLSSLGRLGKNSKALFRFCDYFIYRLAVPPAILAGLVTPHTREIATLAFGSKWAAFDRVIAFLLIAAVFQVLTYVSYWLAATVLSGKRILKLTIWTKTPAVISVLLSSTFGPEGVALAIAVTNFAFWLIFTLVNSKNLNYGLIQSVASGLIVCATYSLANVGSFAISLFSPSDYVLTFTATLGFVLISVFLLVARKHTRDAGISKA